MADSDTDTGPRRETIRKLEGEANYKPWLTQIRLHLGHKSLWKIASGKEPRPASATSAEGTQNPEELKELTKWITKAEKASYIILLSLKEGPLEHVDGMPEDDPKAVLDTLEQLYGTRGDAARFYRLLEEMRSVDQTS
jgi:hypothetical protein